MKKLLSMILSLIMIMCIFTGCGAGSSANEIKVSEMLKHVLEERGEVVMYHSSTSASDSVYAVGELSEEILNEHWQTYYYEGEAVKPIYFKNAPERYSKSLTEAIERVNSSERDSDFTVNKLQPADIDKVYGLGVECDSKGNTVAEFFMKNKEDIQSSYVFGPTSLHVEIGGKSYMLFEAYCLESHKNRDVLVSEIILIEDTEYTKDKTIILDSKENEGVLIAEHDWWKVRFLSVEELPEHGISPKED